MAKFYPAPSGGGTSDFVVEGDNTRGGEYSSFEPSVGRQTAIGYQSYTNAEGATAVGASSSGYADNSSAFGTNALASGVGSTAIGYRSNASAENSLAVGVEVGVSGENSIAIGSSVGGQNTIVIGRNNNYNTNDNEIVIGNIDSTSFTIPGLTLYTSMAQDGDILGWSNTGGFNLTGGFTWAGPEDKEFEVVGGTLDVQPTFDGDPLFDGSYVKTGKIVHFRIDVNFSNILTFGTGQYYLNLPFTPKYNYMFTGGCLHDASTGVTYVITGHVFAGNPQMRLESTDNTGNSSFNIPFTSTAPIALDTADNFHIYGDYIVQ
jgi:hypothetical protein